ncbi:MAG TPA: CHASE3 domain-containing protein [Vicinamibacterales bacterium]|jgi:signal transduction histidine kinase|nr:CHASE3 domain-containing protein [Vicinamibacterales bacterium]
MREREHASTLLRQHLTPGVMAAFIAAVIVLIATVVLGFRSVQSLYRTHESIELAYQTRVALDQVLATLLDAETGERGYVITNNPSYLDPYTRAREAIDSNLAQMRRLMADDPDQQADYERLKALADRKLAELESVITLRRDGTFGDAQAEVAKHLGKTLMDDMRVVVARMEARESARLRARTDAADRDYRDAQMTRIVGIGLGLVSVCVLFVVTMRFTADRRRSTEALERKQSELLETLRLKDEFAAVISHELRTPTNTIAGWSRMLEENAIKPERVSSAIGAIARNADSLRQLVDDLIDTNQLVAGRMRLSIGEVNLDDVIQQAVDAVRLSADNKGVGLTRATVGNGHSMVRGDAVRLKQVAWNLLANAIKFTPAGGHVTVSLTDTSHSFRMEVADTGVGIDSEFLPHVFERFRQGKPGRGTGGMGLGLAIVRHLVELHGGTVCATSAGPGRGAQFVIELPRTAQNRTQHSAVWENDIRAESQLP